MLLCYIPEIAWQAEVRGGAENGRRGAASQTESECLLFVCSVALCRSEFIDEAVGGRSSVVFVCFSFVCFSFVCFLPMLDDGRCDYHIGRQYRWVQTSLVVPSKNIWMYMHVPFMYVLYSRVLVYTRIYSVDMDVYPHTNIGCTVQVYSAVPTP